MKKFLLALLATTLVTPALAAQQPVAQLSSVTASREALRTAINTQLSAVQSNFDEVYAIIDAGPVYVNTTAPADTKVVWIDTDQDNAIKVYVGGVWIVVGGGGSYTLPTAAADTLGGVKVGDRLSIADGVLSADIQTTDISGKENSLGNPSVTGYVLSSTTAGVRSWIEMTGGGTGIAHATSDGNYYASKDGGWASLTGLYAAALGENDNYLTDVEKTRIGELESTDSPVFAGMSFGVASTTTGLVNFYGNAKAYPFGLYSQGADTPAIGWRLPSAMATTASVVAVDTNGYLSYLPSTAIVASGFDGNLATTDDTLQEVAQKVDDLVISGAGDDLGGAAYSDVVALWTTCTGYLKSDGTCDTPSGSATYPSTAGVANWNGSAWGTSYTVGTSANNLVQLNGSAQLPAVSAALLTNFPTLNQDTAGNAATATALASNPTDCTAGQYVTTIAANGNLTCAQVTYSQVGSTPTLGTAAALNVGTSANNIVQLNSSGELPFTISLFDTTANAVSLDPPTVTGSWMTFASTTGAASYLTPGTGVATALGNATGATGGLVTFNGAMGTPSFTALNLPSSDANPSTTAGQLRHDTTITELTGGALKYWNGTNVRTLVDLDTAPSTDDYVVAYDADADKFYMKADATAAGGMTWPSGAGIAVYSGSSTWGTSLTAPSGTIVGTSDTQTLTNKTLTAPIISDSSTLTFDESAADPNDADVVLSATDGVFKIAAANGANNEDLTIDLDATANKAKFNSGSSLTLITTGSIPFTGAIRTVGKSSDYTIGTDDADEAYGSFFVNTGASTRVFTLPSAVAGMSVCVRNGQGTSQILRLDAGSGDYIVKPTGARTSAAAEYYGATADAKNQLCVVAYDATDWYVTSEVGTWTEE